MISVIIPTYNRCNELPRAIESVIGQTLQDWELIIIDDGSTDETSAVVEKYREKHENIFYHYYINMGAGIARNTGTSLAKGELIAFLDSDDIWTENRLSAVNAIFSKEKDNGKFYFTDFRNNLVRNTHFDAKLVKSKNFRQALYAFNFLGGTSNLVVPRNIMFDIKGFDPLLTSTEDHEIYVRLVQQYELAYVPGEFAINFVEASNRISGKNKRRLLGQLRYYQKHKGDMSILSQLLVMQKNALLAYYVRSPVLFKYMHAWGIIWMLKKVYDVKDPKDFFSIDSRFLKFLRKK